MYDQLAIINTCFETTHELHTIAYYSHLVPIFAALLLGIFIYRKSKSSLVANVFMFFVVGFSLWLIGDLVLWTSQDYYLVHFLWSLLDYINVVFFLAAFYLFWVMSTNKDLPTWAKLLLFILQLPALWFTLSGNAVTGFDLVWCESLEGESLTYYKTIISYMSVIVILLTSIYIFLKSKGGERKKIITVTTGLLLFLVVFSVTEFIAVSTGVYEINLYGIFTLPIFLGILIYSIVKYRSVDVKLIGSQALVFSLAVIIGSQFFFIEKTVNFILNGFGFLFVIVAGFYLVRSVKEIERQRLELEKANTQQQSLMRFINHQVKGFLTRSRAIFDALKGDDYGEMSKEAKDLVSVGFDTNTQAVQMVKSILDAANLHDGAVSYQMIDLDLRALVSDILNQLRPNFEEKKLELEMNINPTEEIIIKGDLTQMAQCVRNLIENAIQYTETGKITVSLQKRFGNAIFSVADTGLGLTEGDKRVLFSQGGRGEEASNRNVNSTGYGLYITGKIVHDHDGKITAESQGRDKGSIFTITIPLVRK